MSNYTFKNKNFDPDITPFHEIAKTMAAAFGYTADLDLDKKLGQLLRLHVSVLNHCSYCCILHAKTAREIGIPSEKIDSLNAWRQSELFTSAEKAALEYCEELNYGYSKDFAKFHNALSVHFSEKEIAEIAAVIINMNVWTRLKLAQGQISVPE